LGVKGQPCAEKAMWEPGVQSFREGWATALPCCMTDKKWPPPKGGKGGSSHIRLIGCLTICMSQKDERSF